MRVERKTATAGEFERSGTERVSPCPICTESRETRECEVFGRRKLTDGEREALMAGADALVEKAHWMRLEDGLEADDDDGAERDELLYRAVVLEDWSRGKRR
jgi:hypothetical protein